MTFVGYGVKPHGKRAERSNPASFPPSRAGSLCAMDAASYPERPVFIYPHMQNLHHIGVS